MNTRIKELLTQSGLQPYYDAQDGQIANFAELIVQECASLAHNTHPDDWPFISSSILEHFGVK